MKMFCSIPNFVIFMDVYFLLVCSQYNPKLDKRRYTESAALPMTESLKDTEARVMVMRTDVLLIDMNFAVCAS